VITPEMFAQTVVEDYGLPPAHHATITKLIQDQLSDFKAHAAAGAADADDEGSAPRRGTLSDADVRWWKAWRRGAADRARAAKGEAPRKRRKVAVEDEPLGLDGFEFDEGAAEDEMRIVVKVDVIVGSMKLEDQIEWDVANKEASPEQFAEVYARDLGLTGEFK
jgi:SWI/SNF-related matrix-associated actin-dependent regulator of chromatin subfamily B protein 1